MKSIKNSIKTVTNSKSTIKKQFNLLNQNVMKTNILTAAALLLFTTASIAQTEEDSKPKFEKCVIRSIWFLPTFGGGSQLESISTRLRSNLKPALPNIYLR